MVLRRKAGYWHERILNRWPLPLRDGACVSYVYRCWEVWNVGLKMDDFRNYHPPSALQNKQKKHLAK